MRRTIAAAISVALAVGATLSLTTPACAQQPSAPPDTVKLRFAWPIGTEARVRYTKVVEREEGTPLTSIEVEGEYTMHVHPHPSGLVIEHLEPLATRFVATPALASDDPRRVAWSTVGPPLADWVVSADGELLGLTSEDALAGLLVETLRPLGLDEAETQEALRELMSAPQLLGTARDLWHAMVAAWTDSELVVGESVTSTGEEANPLVPSVVLPYQYEYTLLGMEECAAAGGRCARLQVISFPDPRELTGQMSDALQEMGLVTMSFERLIQLSRMVVLADPDTLLPYQVEVSKRVDGILLNEGDRRVFRRLDEARLVFAY